MTGAISTSGGPTIFIPIQLTVSNTRGRAEKTLNCRIVELLHRRAFYQSASFCRAST
jgi:hypothetical protein